MTMDSKDNLIRCAECKKLGHPLTMVFVWVKTVCGKCATKKLMDQKGMI